MAWIGALLGCCVAALLLAALGWVCQQQMRQAEVRSLEAQQQQLAVVDCLDRMQHATVGDCRAGGGRYLDMPVRPARVASPWMAVGYQP